MVSSTVKIVMAGATGALGRSLLKRFKEHGYHVCVIARESAQRSSEQSVTALTKLGADQVKIVSMKDDRSLSEAMQGSDLLWSSVGASTGLGLAGWKGYASVDVPVNRALVNAAKAANVPRFAYVSLAHADAEGVCDTVYAKAHEAVVKHAVSVGLRCNVLRPTGFFSAFAPMVAMAAKGFPLTVFGDGTARTNPIHPEDLADCALQMVAQNQDELAVGGPEIFTRRQIMELAGEGAKRPARIVKIPATIARAQAALIRMVHPRMGQLLRFAVEVSVRDVISPAHGTRTLAEYFRGISVRG